MNWKRLLMKSNDKFKNLDKSFWANIRSISQKIGYTTRANNKKKITSTIKIPDIDEIKTALTKIGLSTEHLIDRNNCPTKLGKLVIEYFTYRANV